MVFTSLWWNFTLLSCHHDGTRLVFVVLDYNNNMQNLCRPTWLWNVDFRVSTTGNLSPQYCYRPTVLSPLLLTVPHQSAQSKHHSFETALLYIYDHLINATGSQKNIMSLFLISGCNFWHHRSHTVYKNYKVEICQCQCQSSIYIARCYISPLFPKEGWNFQSPKAHVEMIFIWGHPWGNHTFYINQWGFDSVRGRISSFPIGKPIRR